MSHKIELTYNFYNCIYICLIRNMDQIPIEIF